MFGARTALGAYIDYSKYWLSPDGLPVPQNAWKRSDMTSNPKRNLPRPAPANSLASHWSEKPRGGNSGSLPAGNDLGMTISPPVPNSEAQADPARFRGRDGPGSVEGRRYATGNMPDHLPQSTWAELRDIERRIFRFVHETIQQSMDRIHTKRV